MLNLKPLLMSGKEVLPLVEGGKGVAVSNGHSSGAWAATGGVGTFSAVNADSYDKDDNLLPVVYHGKTRGDRHEELVAMGIKGGIQQAQIAHEMSGGEGRIHMNVLWEMGGAERVLTGVLDGTRGLVHGVTCGAGMPSKVSKPWHSTRPCAPSGPCGCAHTSNCRNGWAVWFMKIPGGRAGITACLTRKIRYTPRIRIRAWPKSAPS